ncbi:MAG: hypothetical protein PWQ96_1829 [Clostridia bacterium]|nr:hypothetical protein [Clostridiales bacterium]MDK2986185.1 hypothetical protein [Clostridia bacterium]
MTKDYKLKDINTQEVDSKKRQKSTGYEATAELVEKLDKLVQRLNQLETQKEEDRELGSDRELIERLDSILKQIEKVLERQPEAKEDKLSELEYSLKKWLKIAEVSGKITEVIAGSLHVLIEAIMKVIKEQKSSAVKLTRSTGASQPELSNLLSSISSFIQELSSETKRQE